MRSGTPYEALAESLVKALVVDLPAVTSKTRSGLIRNYRPAERDVEVRMWLQTFANTGIGLDVGVAGQAMMEAYVVSVTALYGPGSVTAFYFGGRFAYMVELADTVPAMVPEVREMRLKQPAWVHKLLK